MAFPQTPLDIKADLKINGVWQDVTADVFTRDLMTIARGRPDEGARTDPGKATLTFNNGRSKVNPAITGRYSKDNPNSDLYGLIGRNTQVRVHLPAAEAHLELDGDTTGTVSTPHVSALNVTGDLDVRVEIDADMTLTAGSYGIVGKWGETTAERAWVLRYNDGGLVLNWLDSGTVAHGWFIGIELIGAPVLRVTLDVDNGASGHTIRFYQGDSITGPWTQLFTDMVGTGTTSIQSTTSPMRIGVPDSTLGRVPFIGSGSRFQVRSGIDGTIVADANFGPLADGATGFTDSAGRVWTVNGTAKVRKRADRLNGEISAWPPHWDVSGKDVWVPVEAAGVLRRYGAASKALDSTLRRRIPSDPTLLAYWPMEDDSGATQAYSPLPGVKPLKFTGLQMASDTSFASSGALPVVQTGATMSAQVPAPASGIGPWQVELVYYIPTAPGSLATFFEVATTGTDVRYTVQVQTNNVQVKAFDVDGNQLMFINSTAGSTPSFFGSKNRLRLYARQNGGNVQVDVAWLNISAAGVFQSSSFAGTVGRVTKISSVFGAGLEGTVLGHLSVFQATNTNVMDGADDGYFGENAGERTLRLAMEENVPLTVRGIIAEQEEMGAQRQQPLLDLLAECAASDGGILLEHRARPALRYRGRATLYNQTPALTLNYAADGEVSPPLEPLDDDADVVNDVTVQRIDGSSARVVLDEGPLSVQAPPNGVGLYDTSVQLSLADDAQAEPIAAWRLHLGTWDAPRYPVVHVNLAAAPHLIDAVLDVDQGDLIRITNLPAWVPPGDVDLIVQGYTESFDQYAWDIYFTCTPGGPWTVGVVGDAELGRGDTDGSQLAASVTSTATTLNVAVTDGPLWITSAAYASEFPVDVRMGGEVVTVTAISSWLTDALGRTVANGWGTSDSGQVWSTGGGTSADYAVGSGFGSHTLATTATSRRTFTDFTFADFDYYGSITTSALATGASIVGNLTGRYADSDNLYLAQLEFTTANAIILTIQKRVAATQTSLGSYTTGLTHVAGTFVRVRFKVQGTSLRAKAWLATAVEPDAWQVSVTDTSLTTSSFIGTRSLAAAGNTNVSPAVRYDNLEVANPQKFTVTRSANGIVKAQAAGEAVQLATPVPAAL